MQAPAFYKVLIYASIFSALIPFFSGIIKFKTLSFELKVLFCYILICVLTEMLSFITSQSDVKIFHAIQNTFTLIECQLLLFVMFVGINSKFVRTFVIFASILFLLTNAIVYFFISNILTTSNITTTIESCLMISVSFLFFYNATSETSELRLRESSFFWISTAVLLYFTTAFSIFLYSKQLANKDSPGGFVFFLSLQRIINIAYNTMLAIALWKTKRV